MKIFNLNKISLKLVHKDPINNKPKLVQIMAWSCPQFSSISQFIKKTKDTQEFKVICTNQVDNAQMNKSVKKEGKFSQFSKYFPKVIFIS